MPKRLGVVLCLLTALAPALPAPAPERTYPLWEAPIEAARDLAALPPAERCQYRYLDIGNVADAAKPAFLSTFAGHVQFISREPDRTRPTLVGRRLLRINLQDYRWDAKTYEQLDKFNFHFRVQRYDPQTGQAALLFAPWLFTEPRSKQAMEDLVKWTGSQVPLFNARAFLRQTATSFQRSPGYYDFLGNPKNYADIHALAGFDRKINAVRRGTLRMAILHSGIADQPRGVALQEAAGGWFSYTIDFKLAQGVKNPIENATADIERRADAFEMIFHLPNKFLGTALFNNKEELQTEAPSFVGYNSRATAHIGAIRSGIDCWSCHTTSGWLSIKDHGRSLLAEGDVFTFYPKSQFATYADYKAFVREFVRDFEPSLQAARLLFETAVKETTGTDSKTFLARYVQLFHEVEHAPVQLDQAARDLGTTPKQLYRSLMKAYYQKSLRPTLRPLLEVQPLKAEGVPPRQWEEMIPVAQEYLLRYP